MENTEDTPSKDTEEIRIQYSGTIAEKEEQNKMNTREEKMSE